MADDGMLTAQGWTPYAIPDEAVAAAAARIREECDLPYMARVRDYVTDGAEGEDRLRQIADLQAADAEADRKNAVFVRAVLQAALPFMRFAPLGDNHHNAALCPYCTQGKSWE